MPRVITWFQSHPLTFTIILACITTVISLFAAEVRFLITKWPRSKLLKLSLIRAKVRIRLLNHLHKDAYRLQIWFFLNLLSSALWFVTLYCTVVIANQIVKGLFASKWALGFGLVLGRVAWMHEVLMQLDNYPSEARKLLEFLATAEQEHQKDSSYPTVLS